MHRVVIAATFISLVVQPAFALSCIRPDPLLSYTQARDADEVYVVVKGAFTPLGPPVPVGNEGASRMAARLTGEALGPDGFTVPFDAEVTVDTICYGPWCGSEMPAGEILAYVESTSSGAVIENNACGGFVFYDPHRTDLARVEACHFGGSCELLP